jgi:WD40 repeat protein
MPSFRTVCLALGGVALLGCSPKAPEEPAQKDAGKAVEKPAPAANPWAEFKPVEIGKHAGGALHVEFSPDGKRLLSTGRDNLVKLWDAATWQLQRELKGHQKAVMMAAFSQDGKLVLSASSDQTARLWDAEAGKEKLVLREKPPRKKLSEEEEAALAALPPAEMNWAAFSPDGSRALTASDDFALKVWDLKKGEKLQAFVDEGCRQRRVSRRRDGAGWVSAAGCMLDGVTYLRFWSEDGALQHTRGDRDHDAHYFAYDRQDRFLVTADGSLSLSIYSAQGSFLKKALVGTYHFALAFGPGDETLLVGTDTGAVFVYRTDTWARVGKLELGARVEVDALALSPADQSLVAALRDGRVVRFSEPVRLPVAR